MVIAERDEVRRECGNRSTDILPDAEIDNAIKFSDSYVKARTSYSGWLNTDPDYEALKEASELIAASSVLKNFAEEKERAQFCWDQAKEILDVIATNMTNGGVTSGETDSIVNIVPGEYRTFPKNPSALYRRPNGTFAAEGVAPEFTHYATS